MYRETSLGASREMWPSTKILNTKTVLTLLISEGLNLIFAFGGSDRSFHFVCVLSHVQSKQRVTRETTWHKANVIFKLLRQIVEYIKTHILCSITSFRKIAPFIRLCRKTWWSQRGHWRQYGACALHVGSPRLQTRSEYAMLAAFSTVTMVTRKRLYITSYLHCLYCY
jgi:hypothetical protein